MSRPRPAMAAVMLVERPGGVRGADLDKGGVGRSVIVDYHPDTGRRQGHRHGASGGKGAGGPGPRRCSAPPTAASMSRHAFPAGVGVLGEVEREDFQGMAALAVDPGLKDANAMKGQRPGDIAEQARPVGSDHAPVRGGPAGPADRRLPSCGRCSADREGGPAGAGRPPSTALCAGPARRQAGPSNGPRRRSGGLAVSGGQRRPSTPGWSRRPQLRPPRRRVAGSSMSRRVATSGSRR